VEGRPVAAPAVCGRRVTADVDVPLRSGLSRVAVEAFDDRGFASNPAVLDVQGPARDQRPDVWVVAVGVDRYPGLPADLQLGLAAADARGVAAAFTAMAGPGKDYAHAHVELLTDRTATRARVRGALAGLARMRPDDLAVVFFGGHGLKPSAAADMVFVTGSVRGTRAADGTLALDTASLAAGGIGWGDVADLLERAQGRVVVLLDACHAGHITQDKIVLNNAVAAALTRAGRAGVVVFAAAKGRQLSYEPRGARGLKLVKDDPPLLAPRKGEHGFFTDAILASLSDGATDHDGDGDVELSELVDEVSLRVGAATGGLQTPWIPRREMFGDFRVVKAPAPRPPASPGR
jgi:hypothetical protein